MAATGDVAGDGGGNGVEARGPLGFFVRIAGRQVVILTLIVAISSSFAFAWWSWVSSPRVAGAAVDASVARPRNPEVKAEHDAILEAIDVQSYVLVECLRPQPNECAHLRLRRPKGLGVRVDAP